MLNEEFYKKVHEEAVVFRKKRFQEIINKENPGPHEELIILEWARMFWRDFV